MLELKNICKIYRTKKGVETQALNNISFTLPNRGLFFILGKSGSGKSTLLNIIGGLDKQDTGDIIIDSKNMKKFKNKDYDYYRNTYVGFVFQDFNLLDEYDVMDNIIISRKLQREKVNYKTFNDLLNKVGISGLEKRRVNELSGGQKQRVAIARALYKNPSIILADEPTGALDEETGRQIFNLLKAISKEKLVIVVSHDRESAKEYADGIIEINDGEIISNSVQTQEIIPQNFKSKKSRLPFLSSLKFALLNLGSSKVKLVFTILLIFMALTFFGVSKILSKFNIEKSYASAMIKNNQKYVTISKASYNSIDNSWYYSGSFNNMNEADINEISKLLNNDFVYQYRLVENNDLLGLDINYKDFVNNRFAYYMLIPRVLNFIEADKDFIDGEIVGAYPTNSDEILIHSYLADYIMQAGVKLYDDNNEDLDYYKPTSYESFVTDQKYLKLGSTKVKVVGIILDDVAQFENLKNVEISAITSYSQWLGIPNYVVDNYDAFQNTILKQALNVYVTKDFVENINLKKNIVLDNSFEVKTLYNEKDYYQTGNYSYLDKNIIVYNGISNMDINSLSDNEIIINESYLDLISDNNYSKLKEVYIQEYNENLANIQNENKLIEENNQRLLDEYYQKLELATDGEEVIEPLLQSKKEEIIKTPDELNSEFINKYLSENNIVNSNMTLILNKSNEQNSEFNNIKIIGVQLEDNDVMYMSNNIAQNLMKENINLVALVTKCNDRKKLEQILKLFPIDEEKYISTTAYSSTIKAVRQSLESICMIAYYASIIFGLFAFILLTNFIVTSIQSNKKTIGILRALGARKLDTFKIFLIEGFLISTISFIFTLITLIILMFIANNYISSRLFFNINFIMLSLENLLILIGSIIGVTFLSSLFTVGKIAKMKPIDAILNK